MIGPQCVPKFGSVTERPAALPGEPRTATSADHCGRAYVAAASPLRPPVADSPDGTVVYRRTGRAAKPPRFEAPRPVVVVLMRRCSLAGAAA
jgi:hypothetical protein